MSARFRSSLTWLLAFTVLAASCADDAKQGGLLLLITSDGPLPLDRLDLTVSSKDRVLHDTRYRVPQEASLPTTFGITSNGDETATVKLTVTGWVDSTPLDRRDAIVTQVPTDRVALLKIVLSGRCSEQVRLEGDEAVSACGQDNTCDPTSGDCVSAVVDASELPTFEAKDDDASESAAGGAGGTPTTSGIGGVASSAAGERGGGAGGQAGNDAGAFTAAAGAGAGGEAPISCELGYSDCGGPVDDDCETATDSDPNNCGACGHRCPRTQGNAYCRDAQCGETLCAAPLADCNKQPKDGCEIDTTASDFDCLKCGSVCSAGSYCTPSGCAFNRDIVVVSSDQTAIVSWDDVPDGDAYRHTFEIPQQLQTPYRKGDQGRLLVVGVIGENARITETSVSYDGVPLQTAIGNQKGNIQSYIFYQLDEQLPHAASSYPITLTVNSIPAGNIQLNVLELKNAGQVAPIRTASTGSTACSAQLGNLNLPLDFNRVGSFSYAIAGLRAGYGPGSDTPADATEVWSQSDQEYPQISGLTLINANGGMFHWGAEVCDAANATAVGAAFSRYGGQATVLP